MQKITPVLLAGGLGSRLWPLSREHYPKQFLTLLGNDSLLQATLRRVLECEGVDRFIVICNEAHRFEVLQQIEQINPQCDYTIFLEPEGRNTAAAAALAAFYLNPKEHILLLPADHILNPLENFLSAVTLAQTMANQKKLVTFGIVPTYPETGYGYIRAGKKLSEQIFMADRFVEKPNQQDAQRYMDSKNYFWNSGMFLFSAGTYLQELEAYAPDIFQTTKYAMQSLEQDQHFLRVNAQDFYKVPNVSIDYAVMELTENKVVIRLDMEWSDIGSWQSLYEYEAKDASGNVIQGDVIDIDNQNCYIRSSSRLIATVGLKDTMIIETPDSILVINKNKTQDVKKVVQILQAQKRPEVTRHITDYHGWGTTTLLNVGENFRVNRVDIFPGKHLSYHLHQHRNEHWIVLSGVATVFIDNKSVKYKKDESFFISKETKHSIENNEAISLSLVEVQSGETLVEMDIERY